MDTPITDRAEICVQIGFSKQGTGTVPIETARALEKMCGELADAAEGEYHSATGPQECKLCAALAKFQAMKDEATK